MVYFYGVILFGGLCWLSWIDLKTLTLPDLYIYPLLVLGFSYAYLLKDEPLASMSGAAMGYCVFVAIELIFKAVRQKAGLGRGDAKLLAVGGAWCGIFSLPLIVALSSVSALIILLILRTGKDEAIPFGPFLSFAIFSTWMFLSGIIGNDLFEFSNALITH